MMPREQGPDVELRRSMDAVRQRLPLLVFVGCMFLAAVVSRQLTIARETAERSEVQTASHTMLEQMQMRLNAYEIVLRSTASFISNRPAFDREAFSGFITSQGLRDSFPGVQVIGYAAWEPSDESPVAKVVYVEPPRPENMRLLGFDLMSEGARRDAIEECIRTGEPVATAPVIVALDEVRPNRGPGIVFFAPVRSEPLDAASSVRGIAFLSFHTGDLFNAILGPSPLIAYSVTDGSAVLGGSAALLDQEKGSRAVERSLDVPGRRWLFTGWKEGESWRGLPLGFTIYAIAFAAATFLSLIVGREIRGRSAAENLAERVRASERAAATAEERYRLFVAQSSEGIWRFECAEPPDRESSAAEQADAILTRAVVAECNAAFALMCGRADAGELVDKPLSEVFGEGTVWSIELLTQFVRNGYRVTGFEAEETVAGLPRVHLHSLVGIIEDGQLRRAWGVVRAVTTERLAQREITQLNVELEARVNERTAALHEANQELEAFTYTVSHDLRSPLRTIAGFGRILSEDYGDSLDEEGRTLLGRIESAAVRLSQLIDALLAYSRLSRVAMEISEVDFSELAHRIADELRDASRRPVEVRVEQGLVIRADASLLEILLANLVSNALKFTSKIPQAVIEIGRNGEEFFVRDNGAGFDPAYADRLFKAFERLHNERDFPGNGIGLASVERIVHRHGGSVRAESAPDQGATFYFRLEPAGPD